ncbi:MAG: ABC transporter ATP-binding protein [Chloroflexota bacterium]|nr:ABC transporter ATP-binding protein [Chloroflexota bacterium]
MLRSTGAATAITLTGVSKAFGSLRVLHDVTLALAPGDRLTLLGPSGCGKTVLLRVVAGLERPDGGTVAFDGRDVTRLPARERGAGMVSADRVMLPYTEPRTLLSSFLRLLRLLRRSSSRLSALAEGELAARIAVVRDVLGDAVAEQLRPASGPAPAGESPPLAVARCLSRGARVLLLDDPVSSLTGAQRTDAREKIGALLRRSDSTAVYATHDRAEAALLGHRIALMRDGRIEQVGCYEELYRRPATTFVAGFVGERAMNLLSGLVSPDGLRFSVAAPERRGAGAGAEWTVPLPPAVAARVSPGQALTLGMRGEALRFAKPGEDASGGDAVLARVIDVGAPLGSGQRRLVTCALGTLDAPGAVFVAELELPAGAAPPVDTPLRLAFDADQVHLFDATGARLDETTPCR